MTSQKRYRHHQENSNNNSRQRDLPPRFKRQKSSSSPTPLVSKPEPQPQKSSQQDKTTKLLDSPQSVAPATVMPMAPSPRLVVERPVTNQVRPRTDILQTPQPQEMPFAWSWSSTNDNAPVLMDNFHSSNSPQSPPVNHVSLGTHFGYINRTASPPMSPWGTGGISSFPGQPNAYRSPTWMSPGTDPFRSPQPESPPSFYVNNENRMPSQSLMTPFSPSSSAFPPHQQSSLAPTVQTVSALPAKSSDKQSNNPVTSKDDGKRAVNYSDPDIRTIEMLRELERVADQKESEGDDFGSDRKSLVSHHLRMLMCAVDRYTEGIDDDMTMNSRDDEVCASSTSDSPELTPVPSPGPAKLQPQDQVKESSKPKNISLEANPSQFCNPSALWQEAVTQPPVSRPPFLAGVPSQRNNQLFPLSQQWCASRAIQETKPQNPDVPVWNPWSSPYGMESPFEIFGHHYDSKSLRK